MFLRVARFALLLLVLGFTTGTVAADSRSTARAHYQAGVKLYNSGDYRGAIREFSAAEQLLPADLNSYNLALCYDKLGDAEPAIQYYRAFLDRQPGSEKRAEIEASIARLEAAARSSGAKRAEREEAARREREEAARREREEAARRERDEAVREQERAAAAARRDRDDARRGDAARRPGDVEGGPDDAPDAPREVRRPGGAGATGTPGSGVVAPTGDAQLDRVAQIDVSAVRDQRIGGGARGGADVGGANPAAAVDPRAVAASRPPVAAAPAGAAPATGPAAADGKVNKPVYKKWWFWVAVGVGAYVAYSVATEESSQPGTRARTLPATGAAAAPRASGLTLMRW
jgi:translation initiation factor IF-2